MVYKKGESHWNPEEPYLSLYVYLDFCGVLEITRKK